MIELTFVCNDAGFIVIQVKMSIITVYDLIKAISDQFKFVY
jgi:hypothetical protein